MPTVLASIKVVLDIFPDTIPKGSLTFQEEFDPDEGVEEGKPHLVGSRIMHRSINDGLIGKVLYWETGPSTINFYANEQEAFGQAVKCFSSIKEPVTRNDRSLDENSFELTKRIMPHSSESGVNHEKQGSIPFLPGFLNCLDVDDHIGADGTDNDPYSDLSSNPLEDAMFRRSLDDDLDDLYLCDEPLNDTRSDFRILVSVSECSKVKFKPLAYHNLGQTYIGALVSYLKITHPSFLSYIHQTPAPGAKATTYGREHIYEVQLISDFMSSVATQTALWQPVNNDFCNWLKDNVINVGIVPNLLHCLPYNSRIVGPNPYMPWLESVANRMKASAIHRNDLATQAKWKKFTMLSTAGLATYMNKAQVRESFIDQSNCMKQEWNTWYTPYLQTNNVQVAGGMNTIYTNFIWGIMNKFSGHLVAGQNSMMTF
ncbi:hypothetical protein B0H10DRAFT_2210173 [Mycena sp. CBHHK59/15]|nr:hypothetical protein B0H10DRAFT_2210173 [Mycena sp. CBHHK59/15]